VRRLRSILLVPALGLALTAAGCGSDDTDVEEVPGPPAALNVPHQRGADDLAQASEDATPTPTPTTDAEADPAAGTDTGATGATGTTETAPAPAATATPAPATQDSPTTDQAPAAGSPPEKFEQFCEENAGAC
jgi:hypothetical protein